MWDAERGQETIRRPGECAGGIACLAEPLCLCGGRHPVTMARLNAAG